MPCPIDPQTDAEKAWDKWSQLSSSAGFGLGPMPVTYQVGYDAGAAEMLEKVDKAVRVSNLDAISRGVLWVIYNKLKAELEVEN